MVAVTKSVISIVLSILLVVGCMPIIAFALPAGATYEETENIEEDSNNRTQSNDNDVSSLDVETNSSVSSGGNELGNVDVRSSEDQDQQAVEVTDPSEENSWRFNNGDLLTSQEGANPELLSLNDAVSPMAAVTHPTGGYSVFNWFDTFSRGHCSGVGAYKGIDVSVHQGSIDWQEVKSSGVDFAIIRCGYVGKTTGNGFIDDRWFENVRGCLDNGIPFGVYIYSYATTTSRASSEADHVLRLLSEAGLDPIDLGYPVFLDMEDASTLYADHAAIATTFCNKIEAAGYSAGVYSSTGWFNERLTDPCFDNWTKWVAQWNTSMGLTYNGLSNFESGNGMWQFSDYGSIPGINGAVDLDYTYMDPVNISTVEDAYQEPDKPYETPLSDGEYIINTALSVSSVLDIESASKNDGAKAQIYTSNNTEAQRFKLEADQTTGFYKIINVSSGKALGLQHYDNGSYSTAVSQYSDYSDNNSFKWIIENNGDGTCTVRSAVNTEYVLDVQSASTANSTPVQIYKQNNSRAQQWFFLPTSPNVTAEKTLNDGLYYIQSSLDKSKVLDVASASQNDKANVQLYAGNNTAAQKFYFESDDEGFYVIRNLNSGKVLDVASGSLLLRANVQQYAYNGTDAQKWAVRVNGDGTFTIVSKLSGQVLDLTSGSSANGTNVQTYYSNQSAAQRFVLVDAKGEKVIEDGTYVINSALKNRLVVDVASASMIDGGNVQTYNVNGTGAQKFSFDYDEKTGCYTIKNVNSGKVLDIKSATYANSTNVQQYSENGTLAQKWLLSTNTDGTVKIASASQPSYVLDVASASTAPGANVQIYRSNDTLAQKWNIEKEDYNPPLPKPVIPEGIYVIESALHSDKVVDVAAASKLDRANVQLYDSNGTNAQRFNISFDPETELYTITNVNSGKVLDVASAAAANKTNVQQFTSNGTKAQKWIIVKNSDETYTIQSALGNYVLDVNSASVNNGANIQIYSNNRTNAQKWHFLSVS